MDRLTDGWMDTGIYQYDHKPLQGTSLEDVQWFDTIHVYISWVRQSSLILFTSANFHSLHFAKEGDCNCLSFHKTCQFLEMSLVPVSFITSLHSNKGATIWGFISTFKSWIHSGAQIHHCGNMSMYFALCWNVIVLIYICNVVYSIPCQTHTAFLGLRWLYYYSATQLTKLDIEQNTF